MPIWLRQSTAVDVAIGPFLDSTDGVTAETGLTISQADVRLKKNSGAWAQVNDNTSATHEENGWYEKELDATDTNTLGRLLIAVHESGALPVWHEFLVVPANVYDSIVAGSDTLDVQVTGMGADVLTASAIAADAITAAKLAADVTTELQNGLATAASLTTVEGKIDTIDNFLDTEIAAILADTNELQTDWADGGRLDLILDARASQASVDAVDDYIDTEVAAIKAKTDNLPASPAATGDIPSAATIADAVWDEDATGHQTQGTFGQAIGDPGADTDTIFGLVNTNLNAEVAAIKAKTDNLPSDPADASDIAASFSTVNATLATIAGYVDTEVAAIKAKTDNLPTDPADQSLIIAATDALAALIGSPAGASVSADIAAVKTDTAAVKDKTDDLTFTVPNQVDVNLQSVNDVAVTGTGASGDEWGPA